MKALRLALFAVAICGTSVTASTPNVINFQGRLTTDGTTAVADGSYSVNFTLYDAPTGGVPQWGETQTVTTSNGLFTVRLGTVILFGSDVFSDSTLWLGITVGADPELTPRTRLISVPYAQHATIGGGWRDDISSVRLNDNADNVGIGTVTPANRLHVVDATGGIFPVRIEGTSTLATITEFHNATSSSTWEYGVAGSDGIFFGAIPPASSYLHRQGASFPSLVMTPDTRVGMGTGSPVAQLHVVQATDTIVGFFRSEAESGEGGALVGENDATTPGLHVGVRGRSLGPSVGIGGYFEGSYFGSLTRAHNDVGGLLFITASDNQASGNGTAEKTGTLGFASGDNGDKYGVWGYASGANDLKCGVYGEASGDGSSTGGIFKATGTSSWGMDVQASGTNALGLLVAVSGTGADAAEFYGSVAVVGTLSKSAGSFRIDHPLDPENKYLQHSFVESPDMMNVYNGNATLDAQGGAVVSLPNYFEALNEEFRYQLTCVGGFAPVYISSEVSGNQFSIAGGTPGLKVSWQVTGVRRDAYAQAHRIQVEVDKSPEVQGKYQHPELYGKPETFGLGHRSRSEARASQLPAKASWRERTGSQEGGHQSADE